MFIRVLLLREGLKLYASKGDAAHTYPVEVDMANSKEHPLKAGMFAHIMFNPAVSSKSLVIPRDALLGSIKDAQVLCSKQRRGKAKKPGNRKYFK